MSDKELAKSVASPEVGPYFVSEPLPRRIPDTPPFRVPAETSEQCAADQCTEDRVSWGVCGAHLAAAFAAPYPGEEDGRCAVCNGRIAWSPQADLPQWIHVGGAGNHHLPQPETL